MRGSWFVVALVAGTTSGCSEWPRSGNLGDAPDYASPDEDVHASIEYSPVDSETIERARAPYGADNGNDGQPGIAKLYQGQLVGGGWVNTSDVGPNCGVIEGYYAEDADALIRFNVTTASYFCLRGHLDTTENVGWDLTLVRIAEGACAGVEADSEGIAYGSGLTSPDAVVGVNVEPGEYAAVIGAYHPVIEDILIPYTVGLSIWAPFAGSAEQCPLLEDAQ